MCPGHVHQPPPMSVAITAWFHTSMGSTESPESTVSISQVARRRRKQEGTCTYTEGLHFERGADCARVQRHDKRAHVNTRACITGCGTGLGERVTDTGRWDARTHAPRHLMGIKSSRGTGGGGVVTRVVLGSMSGM